MCTCSPLRKLFDDFADQHGKKPGEHELATVPFDRLPDLVSTVRAPKGGATDEEFENAIGFMTAELGGERPFTWFAFDKWYSSYFEHEVFQERLAAEAKTEEGPPSEGAKAPDVGSEEAARSLRSPAASKRRG